MSSFSSRQSLQLFITWYWMLVSGWLMEPGMIFFDLSRIEHPATSISMLQAVRLKNAQKLVILRWSFAMVYVLRGASSMDNITSTKPSGVSPERAQIGSGTPTTWISFAIPERFAVRVCWCDWSGSFLWWYSSILVRPQVAIFRWRTSKPQELLRMMRAKQGDISGLEGVLPL